jgi:hypothetical protein
VYGWSSGSILSAAALLTCIAYHKRTRLGRVERCLVLTVSRGRWAAYDNCLLSAEVVVMTEVNRPSTVSLLNTSVLNTEECLSYPLDCPHSPLHPVTEERFIKVSVPRVGVTCGITRKVRTGVVMNGCGGLVPECRVAVAMWRLTAHTNYIKLHPRPGKAWCFSLCNRSSRGNPATWCGQSRRLRPRASAL